MDPFSAMAAISVGGSFINSLFGMGAARRQQRMANRLMASGREYYGKMDNVLQEQLGAVRDFNPMETASSAARLAGMGVNRGQWDRSFAMGQGGQTAASARRSSLAAERDTARTASFVGNLGMQGYAQKASMYGGIAGQYGQAGATFTGMGNQQANAALGTRQSAVQGFTSSLGPAFMLANPTMRNMMMPQTSFSTGSPLDMTFGMTYRPPAPAPTGGFDPNYSGVGVRRSWP